MRSRKVPWNLTRERSDDQPGDNKKFGFKWSKPELLGLTSESEALTSSSGKKIDAFKCILGECILKKCIFAECIFSGCIFEAQKFIFPECKMADDRWVCALDALCQRKQFEFFCEHYGLNFISFGGNFDGFLSFSSWLSDFSLFWFSLNQFSQVKWASESSSTTLPDITHSQTSPCNPLIVKTQKAANQTEFKSNTVRNLVNTELANCLKQNQTTTWGPKMRSRMHFPPFACVLVKRFRNLPGCFDLNSSSYFCQNLSPKKI